MLELRKISCSFGKRTVIHELDMSVRTGEITVLLGNNGAGKSTVLGCIMGLLQAGEVRGSIHYDSEPITTWDTAKIVARGISYVPEGREICDQLSVHENLLLGCWPRKKRCEALADLEATYQRFPPLAARRNQLAGTLSGGEQQMLAIGRALLNKPKLLLLDEPSLGLSPILVSQVFELIHEIRAQGVTILLVEQNVTRALAIADHGVVLEGGRVVLAGSARDLQQNEQLTRYYLGL